MSTRTFEELKIAATDATNRSDVPALEQCAEELAAIGSPEAIAVRSQALGWARYSRGNHSEALEHFQHAQRTCEELGDKPGIGQNMGNVGMVHIVMANYPVALESLESALAIYEELGDRSGIAHINSRIGLVHKYQGNLADALERYRRTLAHYEEIDYAVGVASVSVSLGNVYTITGDFAEALACHHRSLQIYEGIGNKRNVAVNYSCIGTVLTNTGNYPQALEHYHRALALYVEIGDRNGVAAITTHIGTFYSSTGNYTLALEHLQQALALHTEDGNRLYAAYATGNIGNVYAQMQDYALALEYHRRSHALVTEVGASGDVVAGTCNILATLVDMGSFAEADELLATLSTVSIKDPRLRVGMMRSRASIEAHHSDLDGAMQTLRSALSDALKHSLHPETATIHKQLRDLCQQRNDLAGYVEHNNEFTRITEDINGKDTATKLAIQEAERKMAKERSEHEKHLAILHSTLPKHIADRVARGEVVNDHYDNVSVIFLDIVGFTTISDRIPSGHVVHLLEQIFTTLDAVCGKHNVVKIKTIGDSYMAVSFENVVNAASCALDMISSLDALEITMPPALGDTSWTKDVGDIKVRIGIHCGPVTAGVIGTQRLQYDVWGDTVNVASRMESTSEPGKIHVSSSFALALKGEMAKERNGNAMTLHERGSMEIKGKGMMLTYWLEANSE